jgi:hypothetical protein
MIRAYDNLKYKFLLAAENPGYRDWESAFYPFLMQLDRDISGAPGISIFTSSAPQTLDQAQLTITFPHERAPRWKHLSSERPSRSQRLRPVTHNKLVTTAVANG